MNITCPTDEMIPGLRRLWQAAFGDTDDFLDAFFRTAYDAERCRCVTENGEPAAALYWFDCELEGAKLAYIYAVATDPAHRGKGLCRTLMADTLDILTENGYRGALLVPQEPWLIEMYKKMGFSPATTVSEFHVMAAAAPIPVRRAGPTGYSRRRQELLPEGGVIQKNENALFLNSQASLYMGENWVAAAAEMDGMLWCPEFLGDPALAPGFVNALGYREGSFRVPGSGRPFAMFRPLSVDCPRPRYFGLAFD